MYIYIIVHLVEFNIEQTLHVIMWLVSVCIFPQQTISFQGSSSPRDVFGVCGEDNMQSRRKGGRVRRDDALHKLKGFQIIRKSNNPYDAARLCPAFCALCSVLCGALRALVPVPVRVRGGLSFCP